MCNTLSLDDCRQILDYYKIESQNNIYQIKKKAHVIVMTKMCCRNDMKIHNKYDHIMKIIRKHRMYSYNKKNLNHKTMKNRKSRFHNRTNSTSPISWILSV